MKKIFILATQHWKMEEGPMAKGWLLAAIAGKFGSDPQLEGCDPLNVYTYGSHLHGCAGPQSDHDFVVVVAAPAYFPGIRRVTLTTPSPAHVGASDEVELDLNLYHEEFFR
jgi:hypothetical protein